MIIYSSSSVSQCHWKCLNSYLKYPLCRGKLPCQEFPDKVYQREREVFEWPIPVVRDIDALLLPWIYPAFQCSSCCVWHTEETSQTKPSPPHRSFHHSSHLLPFWSRLTRSALRVFGYSFNSSSFPVSAWTDKRRCSFSLLSQAYFIASSFALSLDMVLQVAWDH